MNKAESRVASMRKLGLVTTLAFSLATVGGCIPDHFSYMAPSASVGKVEQRRGACGGPEDYITFQSSNYSWVEVRMSAANYTLKGEKWPLVFVLTVRKKIPFSGMFVSDETAKLYQSWADREVSLVPKSSSLDLSWEGGGHVRLPISFPNGGNNLKLNSTDSFFEQEFILSTFSGQTLDVQMPPFLVDGVEMDFPTVHFQRVEKTIVTPINC